MKNLKFFLFAFILLVSCNKKDQDDALINLEGDLELSDFVWKGMNQYYYWQEQVPNLSDDKATDRNAYAQFIQANSNPDQFFESLLFADDRFSWIVDDYIALENSFQGIVASNGVEFSLLRQSEGSNDLVGWVKFIHPDSDASDKEIQRGDLFTHVNGQELNVDNYQDLLYGENLTYTLGMADYLEGNYSLNGNAVELTKEENFQKNPLYIQEVYEYDSQRIGYLMYNQFASSFNEALNETFAAFRSQSITDLILDLRYNRGGSISTCTYLASLITGQFTGEIFAQELWNPKLTTYWEENDEESLYNRFTDQIKDGNTLNSLRLNRVFILTSQETASASELLINGLAPYIEVIQIGDATVGKNVGSITLYDYIDNNRTKNPNHFYAMQPIVLAIANSEGFADYTDGLTPNIALKEDRKNAGILGDPTEQILAEALSQIVVEEEEDVTSKRKKYSTDLLGPLFEDRYLLQEQRLIIDTYKSKPLLKKHNESQP